MAAVRLTHASTVNTVSAGNVANRASELVPLKLRLEPGKGGGAGFTVKVADAVTVPTLFAAISVYVVVVPGLTVRDPDVATDPIP